MIKAFIKIIENRKHQKLKAEIKRIDEEAEGRKREAIGKNRKEAEEKPMLDKEIDRYLSTCNPTFVLIPEVTRGLISIVIARSTRGEFDAVLTPELYETLITFYNEEFNIFIKMLENKGLSIKGSEERFVNLFVSKLDEMNYNSCLLRYGNFAEDEKEIKGVFYRYFEVIGADSIYDSGNLRFLAGCIQNNIILGYEPSIWDLSDEIKEYKKIYEVDYKVRKMERRLGSGSDSTVRKILIDEIDTLNGVEFEKFLLDLFSNLGYRVEQTKGSGDQGVDVLAYKNDECVAIQAKCYSSSVGNSAVQQVAAGMRHYNSEKGMVVTNNYFTSSAKELAQSNGIILWDRDKLSEMINLLY